MVLIGFSLNNCSCFCFGNGDYFFLHHIYLAVLGNNIKDKCIKITASDLAVLKGRDGHFTCKIGIGKANGMPIVRGNFRKRISLVPKTPGAVVIVFGFGVEQ